MTPSFIPVRTLFIIFFKSFFFIIPNALIFIYKRKKKVLARPNPLKIQQVLPELFPRLVQYSNGLLYDGSGNLIVITSGANVTNPNKNRLIISDGTNTGLSTTSDVFFENGSLTIQANLKLINGTQKEGYILTTDEKGLSSWTSSFLFYFQSTVPTPNPEKLGSRWIHSETGYEYVWISDGTSSNWIQPTQINDIPYTTTEINTASFSTDFEYEYYGVIYNSGICQVYLPLGTSSIDNGKTITIADEVGGISNYNRGIQVFTNGTQSINGYSDVLMKVNFMSLTFLFRNGNWKTI